MNRKLVLVILLFWTVWFGVVTLTNITDALKQLGALPATFSFASGNWSFMKQVTAIYHTPDALVALMFAGVVVWESAAVWLFARAWRDFRAERADAQESIALAFMVSIAFWGAMMIASETFISYDVEATHTRFLIASLASYLVATRP